MNLAKRLAMHYLDLQGVLPAIERIEGRYTVMKRLSKRKTRRRIFIKSTGRTPSSDVDLSQRLPAMRRSGTTY